MGVLEDMARRMEFLPPPSKIEPLYPIIEHLQRLLESSREEATTAIISSDMPMAIGIHNETVNRT